MCIRDSGGLGQDGFHRIRAGIGEQIRGGHLIKADHIQQKVEVGQWGAVGHDSLRGGRLAKAGKRDNGNERQG